MESIRSIIAIAAIRKLHLERFDVCTVFLNGEIEEEVYIAAPEGVDVGDNQVLKLNRALYSLKQAPKGWNSLFDSVRRLSFVPTKSDPCVYVNRTRNCIVTIYVDDGLVVAPEEVTCLNLIAALNRHFETKRVSGELFFGMQVVRTSNGFHLNQGQYARQMLERFKMAACSPVSAPMVDTKCLFAEGLKDEEHAPYRAAIGSLMWLALCTRPDLLFPTILLSRFSQRPKQPHWAAVKRIMRYVKGSIDDGLNYHTEETTMTIEAFSDADWAGDLVTRKSTTGVIIAILGCPVIFCSRQQTITAQSTAEAEFVAANDACKELCWLSTFLAELRVSHERGVVAKVHTFFLGRGIHIRTRQTNVDNNQWLRKCGNAPFQFYQETQFLASNQTGAEPNQTKPNDQSSS